MSDWREDWAELIAAAALSNACMADLPTLWAAVDAEADRRGNYYAVHADPTVGAVIG